MTGSQPLTNCRCLAFVDFSATRKTTKLAGTKDMATIMKMAITTSVPWSLGIQGEGEEERREEERRYVRRNHMAFTLHSMDVNNPVINIHDYPSRIVSKLVL